MTSVRSLTVVETDTDKVKRVFKFVKLFVNLCMYVPNELIPGVNVSFKNLVIVDEGTSVF